MSIYSIGAGFVGGAALAGYVAWQLATAHFSHDLLDKQHRLDLANGSNISLTQGINSRNAQIKREHTAYMQAQAEVAKLQAAANKKAGVANAKAKTILVFQPGDNYDLSSLDAVMESLQ